MPDRYYAKPVFTRRGRLSTLAAVPSSITSDARLKTGIEPLGGDSLALLAQMQPYTDNGSPSEIVPVLAAALQALDGELKTLRHDNERLAAEVTALSKRQ